MAWGTPTSIGSVAGSTGVSLVLTTTAPVPSGALIVVAVAETVSGSAAIGAVTDSALNTYAVANTAISGGTSRRFAIQYAYNVNALASGQPITLAKGNNNAAVMSACYVTGELTAGDPLDAGANANSTGSSTTPGVTSAAPVQAGEIFFAMMRLDAFSTDILTQDTGGGWASPPDYLRTTGASGKLAVGGGYFVGSGSSAKAWAPTLNNSRTWDAMVTAFKVATVTVVPFLRPRNPNTMRHLRR